MDAIYILRLDGFVEPRLDGYRGETVGLGEPGRAVRLLKAAGCEELVFAGIVRRPEFGKLRPTGAVRVFFPMCSGRHARGMMRCCA